MRPPSPTRRATEEAMAPYRRLLVFVRVPHLGEGMPLVGAKLGEASSFRLQSLLIRRTLEVSQGVEAERWLLHTPDAPTPPAPVGWVPLPQGGGEIGERLARAFQSAFVQGARTAVAIDQECPYLTSVLLTHAFHLLEEGQGVVIGPSERGGYYLIGLDRPRPELFERMPYGSSNLLRTMLDRVMAEGASPAILPKLGNVEDVPDWEKAAAAGLIEGPSAPKERPSRGLLRRGP